MSYVLMTDSSADLPWGYYTAHNLEMLPLEIEFQGKCFSDDGTLGAKEFFTKLREGEIARTSQVTLGHFRNSFEKNAAQGNDIIFLGLNSALSKSYENACIAREEVLSLYPERQIYVSQTSCVSLGLGLMVHEARILRDRGISYNDLSNWVEKNKLKFNHLFTVDDLIFLHNGGRVSKASAVVGTVLGIKPILFVDKTGALINSSKVRGRKSSLLSLVSQMESLVDDYEFSTIAISHGDCEDDANFVLDEIKKKFTVHNSIVNNLGVTIGAHAGPGTVALFFFGKERTV